MRLASSTAAVMLCTLLACAGAVDPPPVALSSRDSLVGAGKIVQVENTANEPLTELVITFRSPSGEERTFNQQQLDGFATVEIGWKKLGGWEVTPGTAVEVRAAGFLRAFSGTIE